MLTLKVRELEQTISSVDSTLSCHKLAVLLKNLYQKLS